MPDQALLHPTDEMLSDFGLGRLDEKSADSVHQHLEECPDCQLRVAEISSDGFLERLRDAQEPAGAVVDERPAGRSGPSPRPSLTLPPELVDHPDYQIIRELGRGGMGVVYLAHNQLLGRDEVLKLVSKHLLSRRGILERFLREIRAAAKLHHPNVVSAYSAFRSGESIVFAMEYVDGLDLAKLVATKGPLPVAHACYFVQQVALGLQHAHEHGLVHRDIKPANLMLARAGKKAIVKVLDFGLAKATREQPADGGLTSEGQMLGTPDCIAPEQIRDAQSADIRADIYSLGCTLYYLLTGGPPFHAENLWDLYQAHFSMNADPLNMVRPEVPSELGALVAKMMAKEPERRFQTPAEVAQALTPFFKSEPKAAPARTELSATGGAMAQEPTGLANGAGEQAAQPQETADSSAPAMRWESLIAFKETEGASGLAPEPALGEAPRGPRRILPWVAAAGGFGAVLLLGIIIHIVIDRNGVNVEAKRTPEVTSHPAAPAAVGGSPASGIERRERAPVDQPPVQSSGEANSWPQAQNLGGLVFPPANGPILAMSPDGRLVAQHKADQPLRITRSPDASNSLECGQAVKLVGATFSPDGKYLAGHGDQEYVWLWDTASGKEVRKILLDGGVARHTEDVAFSPDGTRLAAVIFQYHTIKVFDTATGNLVQTLKGHKTNPRSAAFSPDGTRLVSGSGVQGEKAQTQGDLKLWGLQTGECLNLAGHAVRTQSVAFSPDGRHVVSAGADRTAKVWDVKTLECITTFDRHPAPVHGAQFSPDGRLVASIARENAVRVWEAATGREVAVLKGFAGAPGLVQFSPGGGWIFAAASNVLKSWETPAAGQQNVSGSVSNAAGSTEKEEPPAAPASPSGDAPSGQGKVGAPTASPGAPAGLAPSVPAGASAKRSTAGNTSAKPATPGRAANPIVTNTVGMRLVLIPAGEFLMGSADSGAPGGEKPQHRVTISRAFYLGETEVTQEQYRLVTGNNPSRFKGLEALPVEQVSWLDAVQFCNALSVGEKVVPFYEIDGRTVTVPDWRAPGYRLPTEAEWEYACRAGSPSLYSFGNDVAKLGDYAWYYDEGATRRTHPVRLKRPNEFGLYDMHGNVWEWCWDWHGRYDSSPVTDPTGPSDAVARVFRSGCGPDGSPSAHRNRTQPGGRTDTLGFRVARAQHPPGNGAGQVNERAKQRGR